MTFVGGVFVIAEESSNRGRLQTSPSLPGCVVFVGSQSDAEAIGEGGAHSAILAAVEGDSALVWAGADGAVIGAIRFDDSGCVTRDTLFSFASLPLRICAGAAVEALDDEGHFVIQGGGEQITFGSAPVASQRVDIRAGVINFSAVLSDPDAVPSVRYFYSSGPDTLAGFQYPIFNLPDGGIAYEASFDPTHPADTLRNRLKLVSSDSAPSNFLTVKGQTVQLGIIPDSSGTTPQWDPVQKSLYPAPIGDWQVSLPANGPTGNIDLMCGLSGLEYARIGEGSIVRFVPGAPSYAPGFLRPGATGIAQSLTAQCPGSTLPVTTSWAYFAQKPLASATGPSGPQGYYSQPDRGGLFQPDVADQFLQVLELQTATFPADARPVFGAPEASFPIVPYAGVTATGATAGNLYNSFEVEVLSPTRSNAIFAMNWPPSEATLTGQEVGGATGMTGPIAVTPQGMLSTFSPDFSKWERLILATTEGGAYTLELRNLCTQLRAVMLTNQLFLVVSDVTAFQKCCTVLFPGLPIAGWTFALSPSSWRDDTVLILKFAEKSLEDLINDISLWSAPGSSFNDGAATQAILQQSVADAKSHADLPEFAYFLNTVLKDWNGILFLNCNVPPGDFPEQLKGLAAGIDFSQFKAHHLGVNLSPVQVTNRQIRIRDSSLFALIFYDQPGDLVYAGDPYDFKVLSLRVRFANSDISSFSSQIELLVGQLFGEFSNLQDSKHGDNLILNGVMQKHGDQESYSFSEEGTDVFAMQSKVLDRVVINKAQFVTLPQQQGSKLISTRFLLWGSLQFQKLPELDLFSFGANGAAGPGGALQFSNLFVSMDYQAAGPTGPTGPTGHTGPTGPTGPTGTEVRSFAFVAGQMGFDLASSIARPQSLYDRFPLQVTGMLQGDAASKPADLGYIQVTSPLNPGSLGETWFGLRMALSLGSQGGLAAQAGFSAALLAAWAPSPTTYNALVAIQLPGSEGGSKALTIQGPLKLSIGDIGLLYNKDQQAYMMRLSNIALSFLSLKFPPGGRTNLLLFGDPDPKGANTTLGWYAAYKKDQSKTGPTGPTGQRALPASVNEAGNSEGPNGCGCGD